MNNKASILVVDDDLINHGVIEAILDDHTYTLHYATDGLKAISMLPTVKPDLILMDVIMPGIDGIETCRRIKSMPEWQAVPIVMVTSLSGQEYLGQCIEAGAEDFLSKPANPVELCARVQAMVRIKKQYDDIKALTQLQADTIEVLQDSLNTLRRNLACSLPHELNTPLNGIHGIIELLMDPDNGMDEEETQQFLGLAYTSVLRLEKSIQRFLIYFELEISTRRIPRSFIDARSVVENCARKQAEFAKRLSDLEVFVDDVRILASAEDLRFIIEELLENAFKFSQAGTPVSMMLKLVGNEVCLSVHDQGRGMTPEQVATVGAFMQFERKQYEQQGSGLGLAIVNKMTTALGGSLTIESVYQQGTSLFIKLPGSARQTEYAAVITE